MKVLIVDDHEPMRRMLSTLIADLVDDVFECSDGSEVPAAYANHRPDFVLMDLKLVAVDGIQATKLLKNMFPEARVIFVSQWEDIAAREAARQAGAEAFVGKSDLGPLREILGAAQRDCFR